MLHQSALSLKSVSLVEEINVTPMAATIQTINLPAVRCL